MGIPEQRDLDKARGIIADWLHERLPNASGIEISELKGPAMTGFSNETLIFDASWTEGGVPRTESYVLRVKPTTYTVFMESDFENQYRVIKTLGERTDVPVPRVHWYEDDASVLGAPFFVMTKIIGDVPTDTPPYSVSGFVFDATPEQRERLVWSGFEMMTRIHRLDWRALGLGFLDKPQYGELGLDQQLNYYERAYDWAADELGRPNPIGDAARAWIRANRPAGDLPVALCWGDSRISNQMFRDFECVGVLDWEMVTLAPPEMDLAWWMFLERHFTEAIGRESLPGFPSRQALVQRWEERLGRPADNLEFWEVFAGLRFAVVMMRIGKMVIDFELAPPESDTGVNNLVTVLLAKMLGMPGPGRGDDSWLGA
jgi:aminoglycoside phosphotransferase (APT) family kinase protein